MHRACGDHCPAHCIDDRGCLVYPGFDVATVSVVSNSADGGTVIAANPVDVRGSVPDRRHSSAVDRAAEDSGTAAYDPDYDDRRAYNDTHKVAFSDNNGYTGTTSAVARSWHDCTARRVLSVSEDHEVSTPQVVGKWLGIVGLFVAPTTVITSLCYYFGLVSTRKYFGYFGIDSNAIGLTTSDYVVKSITVLFGPIVVLLFAWVALLWAGEYVRRLAKAGRRTRLIRAVGWTAIIIGAVITARGLAGVALPQFALIHSATLTPWALGLGTASMVAGFWMLLTSRTGASPRTFTAAVWASLLIAGAVIALVLFWLTNIVATARGETDAETTAGQLWSRETGVVLDTSQRLGAPANLIVESMLPSAGPKTDATFRYQCFRALVVKGDRWVLVPARWTPEYGYALVVNADPSNRISVTRLKGIAKTAAANWAGKWQCPEVAPPTTA